MDPLLAIMSPTITTHHVLDADDGRILVDGAGGPEWCDVLDSGRALTCGTGDEVLVCTVSGRGRPVVLGRISPPGGSQVSAAPGQDSVVIEAVADLTLRCGEGSITIRKDGKILIRGTDLVSHAKRLNRIKGASVAIN
ncbi:MAG: hypothetical protein H0V44_01460 [Planctomycetes bacterium]|nr:hypothetical protein [Planctomycetota bacterium]